MKRETKKFSTKSTCRKCEVNIGEAVKQKGKLYDEVETLMEFTYLVQR